MTKAKRQMMEDIKLIDLVIELLDARVPLSSRNPDIDEIAGSKARMILLNKADLADPEKSKAWMQRFEKDGLSTCLINSRDAKDMKQINQMVEKVCAAKFERDRKRGIRNRPVRAMVVGIPNVGKSTFINSYARKAVAKTGNKPGVTKGKQWIKLSNVLELLDTPGILWPKFEDQTVGLHLAMIGSIKDEILNTEELSLELIKILQEQYPGMLQEYYGYPDIAPSVDRKEEVAILDGIARVRGCIAKGGELDYLKAANQILENFRNGKIGKITLEFPEEEA